MARVIHDGAHGGADNDGTGDHNSKSLRASDQIYGFFITTSYVSRGHQK